jgi:hypothetical protein
LASAATPFMELRPGQCHWPIAGAGMAMTVAGLTGPDPIIRPIAGITPQAIGRGRGRIAIELPRQLSASQISSKGKQVR